MNQRNTRLIRSLAAIVLAAQLLACMPESNGAAPTASVAPSAGTAPSASATSAVPSAATTGTAAPATASRLALRQISAASALYGPTEWAIEMDGGAANPFDPAQIDLKVRFTSATNQQLEVPAFAYQAFDSGTLAPQGPLSWHARFTPSQAGEWQAQAVLANPALTSTPLRFQVAANPNAHGFVRINKQNPRYFAFDDGAFYFPIGLNLGWSNNTGAAVLKDYERWLDQLSQNGGTVARVWMAAWSFGIEWQDTGLGDYTKRMQQAWLLDQVFKLAEQRGIYLMLCLINHGQFSTTTNPEWTTNPYNQANGGPLAQPQEFVTNAQAKQLFKQRLRYIAARWGYSPNLFAWEWWNEINWTPIKDAELQPWISEMTAELKRFDPYNHLITTSYAEGASTRVWRMPEIDFAQQHDYSGKELVKSLSFTFQNVGGIAPRKPLLLGELGLAADGANQFGGDAIQFHNGLWAAPFSGLAGTGMYWWWDTLIDPQHLWGEYKGIATFMQGQDLAALTPAKASTSAFGATALALQSKQRALAWLHSAAYEPYPASRTYEQAGKPASGWQYQPAAVANAELTLRGLDDGAYTARWFSPQEAAWQDAQTVQVQNGSVTLAAPSFATDIALELVKQ